MLLAQRCGCSKLQQPNGLACVTTATTAKNSKVYQRRSNGVILFMNRYTINLHLHAPRSRYRQYAKEGRRVDRTWKREEDWMGIYFRTMIRNIVSKCRWPDVQVLNILKFVCKTHGFETLFLDIFQYSMERFQRVRPSNRSPECDSTVVPDCQSMLLHSSSQRSKVKNCTSLYPITGVQYEQVLTQNFIYHIYKFKRFN